MFCNQNKIWRVSQFAKEVTNSVLGDGEELISLGSTLCV